MNSINDIIKDIEKEVKTEELSKEASEIKSTDTNIDLTDLGLELNSPLHTSETLQKIANELSNVNSIEEMVKVAEEAGNTDIAALVKIADTIGDRIADRVIGRISNKG